MKPTFRRMDKHFDSIMSWQIDKHEIGFTQSVTSSFGLNIVRQSSQHFSQMPKWISFSAFPCSVSNEWMIDPVAFNHHLVCLQNLIYKLHFTFENLNEKPNERSEVIFVLSFLFLFAVTSVLTYSTNKMWVRSANSVYTVHTSNIDANYVFR